MADTEFYSFEKYMESLEEPVDFDNDELTHTFGPLEEMMKAKTPREVILMDRIAEIEDKVREVAASLLKGEWIGDQFKVGKTLIRIVGLAKIKK